MIIMVLVLDKSHLLQLTPQARAVVRVLHDDVVHRRDPRDELATRAQERRESGVKKYDL